MPYLINGVVQNMRWVLNPNTGQYQLSMPGQWAPRPDGTWVWLPGVWPVTAADRTGDPTVDDVQQSVDLPWSGVDMIRLDPSAIRLGQAVRRGGFIRRVLPFKLFPRPGPAPQPAPQPQPKPEPPVPPEPKPVPPAPLPPKPVAMGVYCVVFHDAAKQTPEASALEKWAADTLRPTNGFKRYDISLVAKDGSPLAGFKPLVEGKPLPVLIVLTSDGKESKQTYCGPEPKTQAEWQKLLDEAARQVPKAQGLQERETPYAPDWRIINPYQPQEQPSTCPGGNCPNRQLPQPSMGIFRRRAA